MNWAAWRGRWPGAHASRFVDCHPHRWHVQVWGGPGPVLLCLHGTGAATHTWRHLAPHLGGAWQVVAPDLPGHGFTRLGARQRSGPRAMAEDLARLCAQEGWQPHAILGHSAGAVLALQMALAAPPDAAPRRVVTVNAALGDFPGMAGALFPAAAKLLAAASPLSQMAAQLFVTRPRIEAALAATGSRVEAEGVALYTALFRDPDHVDGALRMMAGWSTRGVTDRLGRIDAPVTLVAGAGDRTVPPALSAEAARRLPRATLLTLTGGHLLHEEDAPAVARAVGDPG